MRRRAPSFWSQLVIATFVLSAVGCGKVREISACRELSQTANSALAEIEALSKNPRAEQETSMAKRYGELAKQLEPFSRGVTPLAVNLREYVAVLRATDTALRNHAEARVNHNTARMNEMRRELDRLVKRERTAVTRIGVECHS
jgi:hypothetical protein